MLSFQIQLRHSQLVIPQAESSVKVVGNYKASSGPVEAYHPAENEQQKKRRRPLVGGTMQKTKDFAVGRISAESC